MFPPTSAARVAGRGAHNTTDSTPPSDLFNRALARQELVPTAELALRAIQGATTEGHGCASLFGTIVHVAHDDRSHEAAYRPRERGRGYSPKIVFLDRPARGDGSLWVSPQRGHPHEC